MTSFLIIDDDPAQLSLYKSWFSMQFPSIEWRVSRVAPTAEELQCCDAALVDFMLGAARGNELAAAMLEQKPDLRILLTSGHSRQNLEEFGVDLAPFEFIQKKDIEEFAAALGEKLVDWGFCPPKT